MYLVKQVFS